MPRVPIGRFAAQPPARRRLRAAIAAALALPFALLAAMLPPASAQADALVVVGAGDTLSQIAAEHGTTVAAIIERNALPSADLVYSGQRLLVPGDALPGEAVSDDAVPDDADNSADAFAATAARSIAAPSTGPVGAATFDEAIHVVAPGESLFAIAIAYGTTVRSIARANGLGRAAFVHAGQRLIVAGATRDGAAGAGGAAASASTRAASATAAATAAARTADDDAEAASPLGGPRIVIDLSDQTLSAYDGGRLANRFVVSSGSPWTPTPLGTYGVYMRLESQHMTGPGYDLPGVPFVQYFTGNYAIHGAYWHQSFGIPISHGCVNLQPGDAAWLWSWSEVGTPVIVQP